MTLPRDDSPQTRVRCRRHILLEQAAPLAIKFDVLPYRFRLGHNILRDLCGKAPFLEWEKGNATVPLRARQ